MWASTLHNFVQTTFEFKNAIWTVSLTILIFLMREIVNQSQCQKTPALPCMKFTFPNKTLWSDEFQWVWFHLQRSSAVLKDSHKMIFGSIHAWLWEKYKTKPTLTLPPTFPKSSFLNITKIDSALYTTEHFRTITTWEVSVFEVFLFRFSALPQIWTRKISNTKTFYAVSRITKSSLTYK